MLSQSSSSERPTRRTWILRTSASIAAWAKRRRDPCADTSPSRSLRSSRSPLGEGTAKEFVEPAADLVGQRTRQIAPDPVRVHFEDLQFAVLRDGVDDRVSEAKQAAGLQHSEVMTLIVPGD